MSAWQSIKEKVKRIAKKHGAEAGLVTKVAVSALVPGGGLLVEGVGALCDYAAQMENPDDCRIANRDWMSPNFHGINLGFRFLKLHLDK